MRDDDDDFNTWYRRWIAAEPHWLEGADYCGEVGGVPQHMLGLDAWDAMTHWVMDQGAPARIVWTCTMMGSGTLHG